MSQKESKLKKLMRKKILMGATVAAGLVFFVGGIIFWGGFNTAMEATNTLEFCISCHEMENNVYQEYKPTIHYSNRTGVRAGCPDCHVPDPWVHKVVRKIQASNELYHKMVGTVDTPEKFEEHRLTMAKRVWKTMKETDSRECRNCHNFESMAPQFQKPRARKQHLNAFENGQTCIDCHKGIAHNNVRHMLSDEELEELEAPNPEFVREVPQMYLDGLELVAKQEAEEKEKAAAEKDAAEAAEKARIEAAVKEALAQYQGDGGAAKPVAEQATSNEASSSIDVDWSKAASRDITIFYPGQASIEWVLNGRDHGGARPFEKGGDRCVTCHDNETADMGVKIVTGEKAEDTPISGKRGSIPVKVESTHDGEYLYLKFSWEDTEHVPVPFVDGGKMDPENKVKLAIMLATDEVEFADRAGCWGTCHHDARNMPHAPDQATLEGSEFKERIDLESGVTKYLKESRSNIEVKGRRGKMRGGWDKLVDQAAIDEANSANQYMDLIRYQAGTNVVEDGHILEQRVMSGGTGAEFVAQLKGGKWVVEMKRKLTANKSGDVNIESGQLYNFGFAIHDDYSSSRFHHVSLGYKLGLDNAEAEVNVKKQ
ncbi:NapC/NirT family cytochrome c [Aliikangiella sp. G2MR2-5]|uniref:NapC/NirT family cytochrome c n=1 Tax=Aliikangiella sp. G2MR2-5 TaxID=2788943 RepID=UPI0018ABDA74|nr:NapC/NirT family cytochrome c [Aliikangiella sp. G2MR2-5]